ncbi:MAG: hypothetical protein OXF02_02340 [Simkaniaceae bacterium]|nr:hypothetical protein [Simkaniaceae bacterium]
MASAVSEGRSIVWPESGGEADEGTAPSIGGGSTLECALRCSLCGRVLRCSLCGAELSCAELDVVEDADEAEMSDGSLPDLPDIPVEDVERLCSSPDKGFRHRSFRTDG